MSQGLEDSLISSLAMFWSATYSAPLIFATVQVDTDAAIRNAFGYTQISRPSGRGQSSMFFFENRLLTQITAADHHVTPKNMAIPI